MVIKVRTVSYTHMRGVTKKNKEELLARMTVPVHAEIVQREGYKTVVFALDEE